ncbi:Imm21 family immunity protein [Streptomyces erythrochromogenes]|uniref:Imm21 family immunity protein n=1 Tax=Streptomyces erythrochromogenes TaxID=285574 RepID=UPI003684AD84
MTSPSPVTGAQVLVLEDEPATTCCLPEHRAFLRWLAADSEAGLKAAAEAVLNLRAVSQLRDRDGRRGGMTLIHFADSNAGLIEMDHLCGWVAATPAGRGARERSVVRNGGTTCLSGTSSRAASKAS